MRSYNSSSSSSPMNFFKRRGNGLSSTLSVSGTSTRISFEEQKSLVRKEIENKRNKLKTDLQNVLKAWNKPSITKENKNDAMHEIIDEKNKLIDDKCDLYTDEEENSVNEISKIKITYSKQNNKLSAINILNGNAEIYKISITSRGSNGLPVRQDSSVEIPLPQFKISIRLHLNKIFKDLKILEDELNRKTIDQKRFLDVFNNLKDECLNLQTIIKCLAIEINEQYLPKPLESKFRSMLNKIVGPLAQLLSDSVVSLVNNNLIDPFHNLKSFVKQLEPKSKVKTSEVSEEKERADEPITRRTTQSRFTKKKKRTKKKRTTKLPISKLSSLPIETTDFSESPTLLVSPVEEIVRTRTVSETPQSEAPQPTVSQPVMFQPNVNLSNEQSTAENKLQKIEPVVEAKISEVVEAEKDPVKVTKKIELNEVAAKEEVKSSKGYGPNVIPLTTMAAFADEIRQASREIEEAAKKAKENREAQEERKFQEARVIAEAAEAEKQKKKNEAENKEKLESEKKEASKQQTPTPVIPALKINFLRESERKTINPEETTEKENKNDHGQFPNLVRRSSATASDPVSTAPKKPFITRNTILIVASCAGAGAIVIPVVGLIFGLVIGCIAASIYHKVFKQTPDLGSTASRSNNHDPEHGHWGKRQESTTPESSPRYSLLTSTRETSERLREEEEKRKEKEEKRRRANEESLLMVGKGSMGGLFATVEGNTLYTPDSKPGERKAMTQNKPTNPRTRREILFEVIASAFDVKKKETEVSGATPQFPLRNK